MMKHLRTMKTFQSCCNPQYLSLVIIDSLWILSLWVTGWHFGTDLTLLISPLRPLSLNNIAINPLNCIPGHLGCHGILTNPPQCINALFACAHVLKGQAFPVPPFCDLSVDVAKLFGDVLSITLGWAFMVSNLRGFRKLSVDILLGYCCYWKVWNQDNLL